MQPVQHRRPDFAQAQSHARNEVASALMTQVYWWMSVGLGLTGLIAYAVAHVPPLTNLIFGNPMVFYGLLFGELALVWFLSARITRMSAAGAVGGFLFYSALNGLTMAFIFLAYTEASIASTFFITGGTFGTMAVFGTVTKKDLSGWGSFLFMGLIGVIIAMVVNMFLASPMLYWGITIFGVLIFVGLTAYDVQRIRAMAADNPGAPNLAVYGALRLYLDFINLFLMLLRLFGNRR
ncbi:MAG: Bax inhibitor-1/YccA family protein [Deltaproteobacteria bacterium]|nr:Bax inhibitor-1/YccA family protein [Deltaproteobacteria bacterium]